jgi:PKD domain
MKESDSKCRYLLILAFVVSGIAQGCGQVTAISGSFTQDAEGLAAISAALSSGKVNQPPIASAIGPQQVLANTLVWLDGGASADPEGAAVTYSWRLQTPPGSNARLGSSSGTKVAYVTDVIGTYIATLVVNDGEVSSAPVTTVLTAVEEIVGAMGISPDAHYDFCSMNGAFTTNSSAGTGSWSVSQCTVSGMAGSPLWARIQNNRSYAFTVSQVIFTVNGTSRSLNVNRVISPGSTVDFSMPLWANMTVTGASAYFTIPREPSFVVKFSGAMGIPSPMPSASPTARPTATPSASPSATPSASPSASPSATPSASPSATPSASPSATPAPVASVPLYRFNNGPDHFLTANFLEGVDAGYVYEGIAFRVYPAESRGMQALYRCNNHGTADHFASLDPNCEEQAIEGTYGYVYSYAKAGHGQIYRFRTPNGIDHLETLNFQEGPAAGWPLDRTLGFAAPE